WREAFCWLVWKSQVLELRDKQLIGNNSYDQIRATLMTMIEWDMFLGHGAEVYEGQIIGIHSRSNDLTVNCLTGKKLTNMRASGT
ncbi:translational GTPase TypA, partial [Salmonella enterica subsp. enterica serovar Montevideo]|nr:translational GTPase TypA [Salmonella enterica subsp. enterica serovar Montevideo]